LLHMRPGGERGRRLPAGDIHLRLVSTAESVAHQQAHTVCTASFAWRDPQIKRPYAPVNDTRCFSLPPAGRPGRGY
jgi:hypothetical protein